MTVARTGRRTGSWCGPWCCWRSWWGPAWRSCRGRCRRSRRSPWPPGRRACRQRRGCHRACSAPGGCSRGRSSSGQSCGDAPGDWRTKPDGRQTLIIFSLLQTEYVPAMYRVVINWWLKVQLYCDFILSPDNFLSILGAHQMWSIW